MNRPVVSSESVLVEARKAAQRRGLYIMRLGDYYKQRLGCCSREFPNLAAMSDGELDTLYQQIFPR